MLRTKVILIGGAPGVGKTTLGRALAAQLGAASLSIDDLLTATKAVTTPETHPGLHVMSRVNSVDYFTGSSIETLKADATAQHDAAWPAIERVVRDHAAWGSPIVIDGWFLRPDKVLRLGLDSATSFWLIAAPSVLEERERRNTHFFRNSPDPQRMLDNFLARSLWYNAVIEQQATELKLNTLRQDGQTPVEALCAAALPLCA